jgi:hypothetical protein
LGANGGTAALHGYDRVARVIEIELDDASLRV